MAPSPCGVPTGSSGLKQHPSPSQCYSLPITPSLSPFLIPSLFSFPPPPSLLPSLSLSLSPSPPSLLPSLLPLLPLPPSFPFFPPSLSGTPDALVSQTNQHVGAVRSLDVNPFQPNLLASGASESEIFIWDLNTPSSAMSPGNKVYPLEDVSGVAWNRQVSRGMHNMPV